MPRPPPTSTLFPYTTLFRSNPDSLLRAAHEVIAQFARIGQVGDAPAIEVVLGHALRSEEHTSELQSLRHLVCRLLLEKKKKKKKGRHNKTIKISTNNGHTKD